MHNSLKRWSAFNNPFGFVPRTPKPIVHPVIKTFEEFNDKQKQDLLNIKEVIISKLGECNVYAYGSQVNGNWDEESDYDIIINNSPSEQDKIDLRKYNYGFEVDIKFTSFEPSSKTIKI